MMSRFKYKLKWWHYIIAIVYASMITSCCVTAYSMFSEPLFSELVMKFNNGWGLIFIAICGGNFAILEGSFKPPYPKPDLVTDGQH